MVFPLSNEAGIQIGHTVRSRLRQGTLAAGLDVPIMPYPDRFWRVPGVLAVCIFYANEVHNYAQGSLGDRVREKALEG